MARPKKTSVMAVEAYSSLTFSAGTAVASAAGRSVLWGLSAYMREPLRNTAIVAMVGLSLVAGTNVLYRQTHHLPSPLFGSFVEAEIAPVVVRAHKQVMPASRPVKLAIDETATGSVDHQDTPAAPFISNAQVMALQTKLRALSLYEGTADGLFGPRTVRAIKAFEQKAGRTPRGLLTPQILELVAGAAIDPASIGNVAPTVAASSGPAATALPTLKIADAASADPLPAPAPLQANSASDAVATTTTASIDGTIETLPMTAPATVAKRSVQTISVRAVPSQALPAALGPPETAEDASTDPSVVADVQRGLNSLGFLHGEIDGVAGEATAKAIRNFEVYYNYDVTGRITRQLVNLLVQNGGVI
ncbi:MAG: peptidoglycan-binding protein [Devosia sp.]